MDNKKLISFGYTIKSKEKIEVIAQSNNYLGKHKYPINNKNVMDKLDQIMRDDENPESIEGTRAIIGHTRDISKGRVRKIFSTTKKDLSPILQLAQQNIGVSKSKTEFDEIQIKEICNKKLTLEEKFQTTKEMEELFSENPNYFLLKRLAYFNRIMETGDQDLIDFSANTGLAIYADYIGNLIQDGKNIDNSKEELIEYVRKWDELIPEIKEKNSHLKENIDKIMKKIVHFQRDKRDILYKNMEFLFILGIHFILYGDSLTKTENIFCQKQPINLSYFNLLDNTNKMSIIKDPKKFLESAKSLFDDLLKEKPQKPTTYTEKNLNSHIKKKLEDYYKKYLSFYTFNKLGLSILNTENSFYREFERIFLRVDTLTKDEILELKEFYIKQIKKLL